MILQVCPPSLLSEMMILPGTLSELHLISFVVPMHSFSPPFGVVTVICLFVMVKSALLVSLTCGKSSEVTLTRHWFDIGSSGVQVQLPEFGRRLLMSVHVAPLSRLSSACINPSSISDVHEMVYDWPAYRVSPPLGAVTTRYLPVILNVPSITSKMAGLSALLTLIRHWVELGPVDGLHRYSPSFEVLSAMSSYEVPLSRESSIFTEPFMGVAFHLT